MAAKNDATTGSMKCARGDEADQEAPKNQTGIVMSMPLPPSKSKRGTTMGSPMTSARR
jgi:hypothetical protein